MTLFSRMMTGLVITLYASSQTFAQNCSVNANIDRDNCVNQPMSLNGSAGGLFQSPSDLTWTQIAGPSLLIDDPNAVVTEAMGYTAGNAYTFRLSTTCEDGVKVSDDVTITTLPVTTSQAGANQTACPGTSSFSANAVGTNESGLWSLILPNNAGVSISSPTSSPTTNFTTSTTAGGQTRAVWTISNTNGCVSRDTMLITNYGGVSPVSVTPNSVTLGNCYSTTQCYNLVATFGGRGFGGQEGVWSQVSGPTNVVFGDINDNTTSVCNLQEGCYKLKWTVSGPCASGSDTIRICVPAPTQSVSPNTNVGREIRICDGRTAIELKGTTPVNAVETVLWTQITGPAGPVIDVDTSPATLVTNLTAGTLYQFRYTITNPVTGCSNSRVKTVRYYDPPFIAPISDTILGCLRDSVRMPITATGGSTTSYRISSAPSAYTGGAVPTGFNTIGSELFLSGLDAPGTYVIDVRREVGDGSDFVVYTCPSYLTSFKVVVSETPLGATAGTDQSLPCNATSTNLAGNTLSEGFGIWTQVSGPSQAVIADSSLPNSSVSSLVDGRYTFRWIYNGGSECAKPQDDVDVVVSSSIPQNVSAGANRTVCYGSTIALDANVPGRNETGTWSVTPSAGVTIENDNNPKTRVSGLAASTAYTFRWIVTNICGADTSFVTITTNATQGPPQADAGLDRCLASGTTSITLSGNDPSPADGLWTQISGPFSTITFDTAFNSTVTGMSDGNYFYQWINTVGTCDTTRDTVQITIAPSVSAANAGADMDSCSNSVTLDATAPAVGTGEWVQYLGPAGWEITDKNDPKARVTNMVTGEYQFIWRVTNGACSSNEDTTVINIDNSPSFPEAGGGTRLCGTGTSVTLQGSSIVNGSAVWSLKGLGPNTPTIANPSADVTTASGLIQGIYVFERTAYSLYGLCPSFKDTVADTIVVNANAGPDIDLCEDQSNITLAGPENTVGTWTKITGGAATLVNTSANSIIVQDYTSAGSPYSFEYFTPSIYGCPASRDTMILVIDDTTNLPDAGTDQFLCSASGVTLAGNSLTPNSGLWTKDFGGAATITDDTLPGTTVTGMVPGIYLFKWQAVSGACRRSDEVRIEIALPPTPTNAGNDTTICPDSVFLKGNEITLGVGEWSQISGPSTASIEEPVNPETLVKNLSAVGTYSLQWKSSNGPACPESLDTVDIIITHLNPTPALAGEDSAICFRTNTQLDGNTISIGSGLWDQVSGPSATITTPGSANSALTLTSSGTYVFEWKSTNGACESMDTVVYVLSDSAVDAIVGDTIKSCVGENVELNATDPSPQQGVWRQISGPTNIGFIDSNVHNTLIFGQTIGTYEIDWIIESGSCPAKRDTAILEMVQRPADAIAGLDVLICDTIANLQGSEDSIGSGTWTHVSGPNVPAITNPNSDTTTATGLANGVHKFKWTITNGGCSNEDSVLIELHTPNANDNCSGADSLTITTPSTGLDSLCAATAEVGEPSTCGKAACNSMIYKVRTKPFTATVPLDIIFTEISTCTNGLRVTLFRDGPCPSLGAQFGTCRTISTADTLKFTGLSPNTVYYIVVDDNSATCGTSDCQYNFTLGNDALPVELMNFDVHLDETKTAHLDWATASELNNSHFEVQRKLEYQDDFVPIGRVEGNGTTSGISEYQYKDDLSFVRQGAVFYRLKQIDFDGAYEYTDVRRVQIESNGNSGVKLAPNPTKGVVIITTESGAFENFECTVYNAQGRLIFSDRNNSEIDLSSFAEGIYFITLTDESGASYAQRVVLAR
jgi:hypothetical protein